MSQTQEVDPEEEDYEKTVTVVGYTGETEVSCREFAIREGGSKFSDVKTVEDNRYFIVGDGLDVEIESDEYATLRGLDTGDMRVERRTTESTSFKHTTSTLATDFVQDFIYSRGDRIPEGMRGHGHTSVVRKEDGYISEKIVKFFCRLEYMDMLTHPSEFEPDNMYEEDEPEQIAFKFKIRIRPESKEESELLDEVFIKDFVEFVKDIDSVRRVRWVDCEEKIVKKNVCYNI